MKFASKIFQKLGPLIGLIILCFGLSLTTENFLSINNLLNVIRQVSINAVLAAGSTLVILTAGIDLSVGSVLALCSAITAGLMLKTSPLIAILIGLLSGTIIGSISGLIISKGKIPPFVVTLGMMTIARSLTLVYTGGMPISNFPESFLFIGEGQLLRIPMLVIIAGFVFLITHLLLSKTRFGRYVYAIGGNEKAAWISGINVSLNKTIVYALNGMFAALGGIMLIARLDSAQPQAGLGYELDAIAAVVIGGTSLSGGRGGVPGTIIGALIMGVLRNGLNLLNVSAFWQQAFIGAVIIVTVLIDRLRKGRG